MLATIAIIMSSIFVLLFAIYHFFGNRELYEKTSHIPGPLAIPLIGHAYLFIGDTSSARDVWRVHRKLIQPAFVPKILHSFVTIFQKTSILLMDEWADQVDQPEFEVHSHIAFTSFRNICESSLGMPVTTKNKKKFEQYIELSERVFQVSSQRPTKPWLYSETIFKMTPASKVFYNAVNFLKSYTMNVIEMRRNYLRSESFLNEDKKERKTFLDLMLEMADNGHFTDEEVREHSDTMITAVIIFYSLYTSGNKEKINTNYTEKNGCLNVDVERGYDTVARVNGFILLMLASHPDIQDKVYAELYQIYGSDSPDERPVEFEDLKKLEYLERVIKETMRLFPVVPVLARTLREDFFLDGYNLPKGCGIVISIFALHRNEKYWPDPLKFDPDRFLPEIDERRTPYCYMPFSLGPRNCIGGVYAMMSMKILLATLLRKYVFIKDQITPNEDIKITADVMLHPAEPITMRIKKRVK